MKKELNKKPIPLMPEWKKREIENLNRVLEEHAKLPYVPPTEPYDC